MAKSSGKKKREYVPPFERKARKHFEDRWRRRISPAVPKYSVLKEAMQSAARGVPSTFFSLHCMVPPHSSRWRAKWQEKEVIVVYDHAMKLPVSCWVHTDKQEDAECT